MFNKLKQFKDLKEKAKVMQEMLSQETAEGVAGWGKVKIVVDGTQRIVSVTIDPSVLNDHVKLEEMIRDAANDAMEKIQKTLANKMREGGGMDLMSEFGDMLKGSRES